MPPMAQPITQEQLVAIKAHGLQKANDQQALELHAQSVEAARKTAELTTFIQMGHSLQQVQETLQAVLDSSERSSTEMETLLKSIHQSIELLKETPDTTTPIVSALQKLENSLQPNITVKAPEVTVTPTKVEPQITVSPTPVTVEAPVVDLSAVAKALKTDLPKLFQSMVKDLLAKLPATPTMPDHGDQFEQMIRTLQEVRDRPIPIPTMPSNVGIRANNTQVGTQNPLPTIGPFAVPAHDNGIVTYPNPTTEVYTFYQGLTPVGTVTIVYTDSTKVSMASWSR